jgi:hypothetical protein
MLICEVADLPGGGAEACRPPSWDGLQVRNRFVIVLVSLIVWYTNSPMLQIQGGPGDFRLDNQI